MSDLALSLYGAWRLAHFESRGMAYFDRTVEGFWRSFQAAVIIAPATALLIALHLLKSPIEAPWLRIVLVEGIAYVISVVAFPLLMVYVARLLDRETEYFGYIVAYNWSMVVGMLFLLPVSTILVGELLPENLALLLFYATLLALVAYAWFIARTALRVNGLTAAAVVALDLFIGQMLSATARSMLA